MPSNGILSREEQAKRNVNIHKNRAERRRDRALDRIAWEEEKINLTKIAPLIADDLIAQALPTYIKGYEPYVSTQIASEPTGEAAHFLQRQLKKDLRKKGLRRFTLEIAASEDLNDGYYCVEATLMVEKMKVHH